MTDIPAPAPEPPAAASPAPLWRRLQQEAAAADNFEPVPGRPAIAAILKLVAKEAADRGAKHLDVDPGETADWLEDEARRAREGA